MPTRFVVAITGWLALDTTSPIIGVETRTLAFGDFHRAAGESLILVTVPKTPLTTTRSPRGALPAWICVLQTFLLRTNRVSANANNRTIMMMKSGFLSCPPAAWAWAWK